MSEGLVLSASSVAAFESCGYRWYLQYIEMHEGVQSLPSAIGTAVHAGAEHFYRQALAGELAGHDEVSDVADLAFLIGIPDIVDADEDPLKSRPVVGRVMVSYLEDVAEPMAPNVLAVEEAVEITVDGIPFSGHPDVMEKGKVHDTKVVKQRARYPQKYLFQMTGGALLYQALFGEVPVDRVVDQMIRLKRDRPRHEPIAYGELRVRQLDDFKRQLSDAADGITRGDFEPTGLATGECRYCPVRYLCDYYPGGTDGNT